MGYRDPQTLVQGLIASHGTQLRRFLLARLRHLADLPDIMQEIYLRMLRVPNSESIRSPEAYLFTVAQHVVQQYSLRLAAVPSAAELSRALESTAEATPADPAQELAAQQCLERLQEALEGLPPKVRATFLLHRRDGLDYDEIGRRLGLSRPMVKKYLMKAVVQLRLALETGGAE